jgi:beta-lactam-binding protein with PASTA domain
MPITDRVWSAGKLVVLGAALVATYGLSAIVGMRWALRASEVSVPDLKGKSANEASSTLSELGLTLKVDDARRVDQKIGPDRIVQQEPSAGATARRQRSVRVWLNLGANATVIPKLTGFSERTAELRVVQEGLVLNGMSEIRSSEYPVGMVIAQEPPPDTRATHIALLVNRGEAASGYVMPDLIGVNGDRAADLLRNHGFRVAVVSEHPYPGVPAGVVLRQSPQGGFQIAPGEAISLEVSR